MSYHHLMILQPKDIFHETSVADDRDGWLHAAWAPRMCEVVLGGCAPQLALESSCISVLGHTVINVGTHQEASQNQI